MDEPALVVVGVIIAVFIYAILSVIIKKPIGLYISAAFHIVLGILSLPSIGLYILGLAILELIVGIVMTLNYRRTRRCSCDQKGENMNLHDPIHGRISVTNDVIRRLIQTQAFQRLKGLKQQGNTYFLLPDTTHNRYSHSLGVYENMRKIIDRLVTNGSISLTEYEKEIALGSALLHDIGHGPYSHCFENITGIHHEKWTIRIIKENLEISEILLNTPGLLEAIVSVIERKGAHAIIEELLFSQIGADKLDYHLRDLYYSGISQEPYNLETLVKGLHFHERKLVINSSVIQEVEKFVIIKRKLFEQGFNHPDVIGKDILLKLIFNRAKYLHVHNNFKLIPFMLNSMFCGESWSVNDYLQLNDHVIYNMVRVWSKSSDSVLSILSKRYLAKLEDSIMWREVDTYKFERKSMSYNPFMSEYVSHDEKYGCYRAGISVLESGKLVDVIERSKIVKQYSSYVPKKLYYYIE